MNEFLILSTVLQFMQQYNFIGPVKIIETLDWWPGGPPYLVRIRLCEPVLSKSHTNGPPTE